MLKQQQQQQQHHQEPIVITSKQGIQTHETTYVPLWKRQELFCTNPGNQSYSIDSAQKKYEKNRKIREQQNHEKELLDLMAVIKPQIIIEKGVDELEKERKYIKTSILNKRYKKENPEEIGVPGYETLKRRYFKQDDHGLHVCEDYEHMNTGEKFLLNGRFHVATGNAYVCKECGKSHLCTPELCKESIITLQNEAQVCRITAKVVGGITAIADDFRPYHYHLDTTQQASKNTKIVTEKMKTAITEHELIEQVMKEKLEKNKKNARSGRTTLRSISKKHLLPEVHDLKSNERCKKTFNAILDIVNDILRPPNIQDICASNICAYHNKGWENVKELIMTNNYNHLGDLINCYTDSTQHVIPHLMNVRRYTRLVDANMTSYFASCIFHLFRIICGAHNVESMQGTKNLTFNDTVISLLYLLKTGYSGVICISTPGEISKHLKSKKSRHPVIVLSNDTQDCGMPIETTDSNNTFIPTINASVVNDNQNKIHDTVIPSSYSSPTTMLAKHKYCTHKIIEFIPGHSILDSVLLAPEFINFITISSRLSTSSTKNSGDSTYNHTNALIKRRFNSSAKSSKSTINSECGKPNADVNGKPSVLLKRKNRSKSTDNYENGDDYYHRNEDDNIRNVVDEDNDCDESGDRCDTMGRSTYYNTGIVKKSTTRPNKFSKTNDNRRLPTIVKKSDPLTTKHTINKKMIDEASKNMRNTRKPVVMSGDIPVNKTYQSILNDPKNLQSEQTILKSTLGNHMTICDDYR